MSTAPRHKIWGEKRARDRADKQAWGLRVSAAKLHRN